MQLADWRRRRAARARQSGRGGSNAGGRAAAGRGAGASGNSGAPPPRTSRSFHGLHSFLPQMTASRMGSRPGGQGFSAAVSGSGVREVRRGRVVEIEKRSDWWIWFCIIYRGIGPFQLHFVCCSLFLRVFRRCSSLASGNNHPIGRKKVTSRRANVQNRYIWSNLDQLRYTLGGMVVCGCRTRGISVAFGTKLGVELGWVAATCREFSPASQRLLESLVNRSHAPLGHP